MGISRVSAAAARGAVTNASAGKAAVRVTRVSARDRAYFSERAQTTVEEEKTASVSEKTADNCDEKKSLSELIKEQTEKIDRMFSRDDSSGANERQLASIKLKLRSGRTLSANEEQYLSKYDPDSYSNYRTTLDARRMFRTQLSCCRTKDEVNGMRLSNAVSALASYKKALKHGGDGSEIAGLNMALEREISDFSKSARYRSLPTSAERDKYYMELAKARRYEREKRAAEKLNAQRKKKKQLVKLKQPGDGKRTVAQVENSPLGRKVRSAERVGSCMAYSSSLMSKSYSKMDQKG